MAGHVEGFRTPRSCDSLKHPFLVVPGVLPSRASIHVDAALRIDRPGQHQRIRRHSPRTRELVERNLLQRFDLLAGKTQLVR